MSKKSLEKLNSALVGNLLNELLFYIPENDLTKELVAKLENIDSKSIFNKVFIILFDNFLILRMRSSILKS